MIKLISGGVIGYTHAQLRRNTVNKEGYSITFVLLHAKYLELSSNVQWPVFNLDKILRLLFTSLQRTLYLFLLKTTRSTYNRCPGRLRQSRDHLDPIDFYSFHLYSYCALPNTMWLSYPPSELVRPLIFLNSWMTWAHRGITLVLLC